MDKSSSPFLLGEGQLKTLFQLDLITLLLIINNNGSWQCTRSIVSGSFLNRLLLLIEMRFQIIVSYNENGEKLFLRKYITLTEFLK